MAKKDISASWNIVRVGKLLPAASTYDQAVLADSPVAYLTLGINGGIYDMTGNYNTGAAINGPTTTTMPNGDGAFVFDGATQYIEVNDADELSVPTTGILTVEAWIHQPRRLRICVFLG
jgi:hypothetical protein